MSRHDRLLSVEDLAEYLDVPVATLYAWRYRRQGPPGFRVGRHVRFRWSDVQRWIEGRIAETYHSPMAQSPRGPTSPTPDPVDGWRS